MVKLESRWIFFDYQMTKTSLCFVRGELGLEDVKIPMNVRREIKYTAHLRGGGIVNPLILLIFWLTAIYSLIAVPLGQIKWIS